MCVCIYIYVYCCPSNPSRFHHPVDVNNNSNVVIIVRVESVSYFGAAATNSILLFVHRYCYYYVIRYVHHGAIVRRYRADTVNRPNEGNPLENIRNFAFKFALAIFTTRAEEKTM